MAKRRIKCINPCLEWIDLADPIQCAWALEYLKKSGLVSKRESPDNISDYLRQISPWIDGADPREIKGRMRSAWRHLKRRSSSPMSSISLPAKAKEMLKGLARQRNKPANKLLQELIEDHSKVIKDLEDKYNRKFEVEIGAAKHSVRMKGSPKEWDEYQYEVKRAELLEQEVRRLEDVALRLISDRAARLVPLPNQIQQHDMYDYNQRKEYNSLCNYMGVGPTGYRRPSYR